MKAAAFALFVVLLTVSAVAYRSRADLRERSAARGLLELMRRADAERDYQAIAEASFWSAQGRQTATVQVFHRHPNQRLLRYGERYAFGCDGEREWTFDAKKRLAAYTPGPPLPKVWQRDLDLLEANYIIRTNGAQSIAGRAGVAVELNPRQMGRPRVKLVVDRETGVALAQEQFDGEGRLLSSTVLKSLDLAARPAAMLFDPPVHPKECRPDCTPMSRDSMARVLGFAFSMPSRLPAGFREDSYAVYQCDRHDGCSLRAAMATFTDGLDQLTVFETRPPHVGCGESRDEQLFARFGAGAVAHIRRGQLRVVVVGGLPESELRQVAESVAAQ